MSQYDMRGLLDDLQALLEKIQQGSVAPDPPSSQALAGHTDPGEQDNAWAGVGLDRDGSIALEELQNAEDLRKRQALRRQQTRSKGRRSRRAVRR
jgi:hypothetical protein